MPALISFITSGLPEKQRSEMLVKQGTGTRCVGLHLMLEQRLFNRLCLVVIERMLCCGTSCL